MMDRREILNVLNSTNWKELLIDMTMVRKDGIETHELWLLVDKTDGTIKRIGGKMFSEEGCVNVQARMETSLNTGAYTIEVIDSKSLLSEIAKVNLERYIEEFNCRM